MREILFRGKRTDNGAWTYGYLFCAWERGYQRAYLCWGKFNNHPILEEVIPETIGQYTGLKDKNGEKIFEGDILHIAKIADGLGGYYHPPLDCPVNVVVKWDLCAWMWETLCENKRYISFPDAWCHYECEIIGNIHDNYEKSIRLKRQRRIINA